MKKIEVVAGIIIYNKKILCVQKGKVKFDYISYKYEFPGGKVEELETNEAALKREIKEELNMDIEVKERFLELNHTYPDFNIIMNSYICSCKNTKFTLTEHIDFKWLSLAELNALNWAAADIPIVNKLIDSFSFD